MRALSLMCIAALAGISGFSTAPVLAHAGHGDEFVQTGSVGQVKANPNRDQLLGIVAEKPKLDANGQLSVPNVALSRRMESPMSSFSAEPLTTRLSSNSVPFLLIARLFSRV